MKNLFRTIFSSILAFSSSANSAELSLPKDIQILYEYAESYVKNGVTQGYEIPIFAASLDTSDKITVIVADEYPNLESSLAGILEQLIPLAKSKQVKATIIVSQMQADGERAIVFDGESPSNPRILVILPIKGNGANATYGKKEIVKLQDSKVYVP